MQSFLFAIINKALLYISFLFLFFSRDILSQQKYFQKSSLYSSFDSKTLLLGESVIANSNEPQAFKINPASTSFNKQILLTTSYIKTNDVENIYNIGFQFPTNIGKWGLSYSGFSGLDYFRNVFSSFPTESVKGSADNTITLSYGNSVIRNLNIGVNINFLQSSTTDIYDKVVSKTSNTFFDLGLIYMLRELTIIENTKDELNFGLSLQGLGGKVDYLNNKYELPKFLRIGFMYSVLLLYPDGDEYLKFTLNGLYRNYLNPQEVFSETSQKDLWTLGLETRIYKHFNIYLGGNIQPNETQYGGKGNIILRYGLGYEMNIKLCTISINAGIIPSALNIEDTYTIGLKIFY